MNDDDLPLEDQIEDIVTYLSLCDDSPSLGALRGFDQVEPNVERFLMGRMSADLLATFRGRFEFRDAAERADWDAYFRDMGSTVAPVGPSDLRDPIDICVLERGEPGEGYRYALSRLRRASRVECSGHVTRMLPVMCELRFSSIDNSGVARRLPTAFVGWDGTRWTGISRRFKQIAGLNAALELGSLGRIATLATGAQLSRELGWRVALGYGEAPRLSFATDPVGVREVFRLRDIPEGRSRRDALCHWVREHWRQKREAPDGAEATKVREHLRGAREFTWNGLRCTIRPSAVDLERAAPAAERRRG
jgi:hypothetical protein